MKKCTKCSELKELSEFTKNKKYKDGLQYDCRDCRAAAKKKYREENKEKINSSRRRYRKENKYLRVLEKRERQSKVKRSIPTWNDRNKMKVYYNVCSFFNEVNGYIKYHVDHIIPLNGKTVCGLHVHTNLQVILAKDNMEKGNKHE